MDNHDIAAVLARIGWLLEIRGDNAFRARAYHDAAVVVRGLAQPVSELIAGDPTALERLPGIGHDLAGKIAAIARTGTIPLLAELEAELPPSLVDFLRIPGIGAKRARLIHDRLGIVTIDELHRAASEGRLRDLPRVGSAVEARILAACRAQGGRPRRFLLAEAEAHGAELVAALQRCAGVVTGAIAGSVRRRRDSVGDVDLVVAATESTAAVRAFCGHEGVVEVAARGETRCAVRLDSGLGVDLRIVRPESYGAALLYFTGSRAHTVALRSRAQRQGFRLNEYGLFHGSRRIAGETEEGIYRTLGLTWVPPELREDRGEIDAAEAGTLPRLLQLSDIRGDLHLHTDASDGVDSLEAMVSAAIGRGHEYIAITDHARRGGKALAAAGLHAQGRAIRSLRRRHPEIEILAGAEVDVAQDGSLDLDEDTLDHLDYVVAGVHCGLDQDGATITSRLLAAIAHPRVMAIAHPSGRLIEAREPAAVDFTRVCAAAADHGVWLEVNAQPERLDLDDLRIRQAIGAGARVVIGSDAHRTSDLALMRFGVDQARRGWCEARHVANATSRSELLAAVRRRRTARHRVPA